MIIWKGPSEIDGSPIMVVVTFGSNNSKTGDMPQIWILRSDIHPTEALRNGGDRAICGDCPYRPQILGDNALKKYSRKCYVSAMSFNAIYKKYKNGGYPEVSLEDCREMLKGKKVRLGAYGDPVAVPIYVWDMILADCQSTGYTHQWRNCDKGYAKYCMSSCDSPMDVLLSTSMGYRAFFVQAVDDYSNISKNISGVKLANCPASKEMGKVTTCAKCLICSGTRSGLKSNVTIAIH